MSPKLNIIAKRLLTAHGLYVAARAFLDVFLAIYIWKLTNDLSMVAWFNIVFLMSHTITFTVFAGYVKRGHLNAPRIWGTFGVLLTFIAIALIKEQIIQYLVPLAVVIGFFNSLYWLSYHIGRFDYTNVDDRTKYTGLEKAIGSAAAIIIPILGGYIITANYFGLGYANIFIAGTILFIASLSFGVFRAHVAEKHNSFDLKKTWELIRHNKDIMKSMWSWAFSGFARTGSLYKVLLPLFLFDILNNEFHLGGWLSIFATMSILTALTLGKYLKFSDYRKTMTIGGGLLFLSTASLVFWPVFIIYVIYGIVKEVFSVVINIPKRVISENLVHEIEDYNKHRIEYFVIREWFVIGFGRIPSYVILLLVGSLSSFNLRLIILLMSLVIIGEVLILRSVKIYNGNN